MQSRPNIMGSQAFALSAFALFVVPAILRGKNLPAQTQVPQATREAQQQNAVVRPASEMTRTRPPALPSAQWSAERRPDHSATQARVSWDGRGLEIEAFNSSLADLLRQVAAVTGAKLKGSILTQFQDQRIFGSFGPGRGCDVLSKVLEGSGYNVLMIGSRDVDAPLEIVLSARSSVASQTSQQNRSRPEHVDASKLEPEPQPSPESPHSQQPQDPYNIGGPPRDPMEFMQEILQRQHVIDEQQQDQRNNLQQQ